MMGWNSNRFYVSSLTLKDRVMGSQRVIQPLLTTDGWDIHAILRREIILERKVLEGDELAVLYSVSSTPIQYRE